MEVNVLNIKGEETGKKVTLNDAIFAIEPNDHAIYLDVKQYMANQRQASLVVRRVAAALVVVISTLQFWLVVVVYSVQLHATMASS